MTQLREALTKAGIMMPDQRLRNILAAVPEPRTTDAAMNALVASKDVEAALALFDPQVVAARLRGKMKEIGACQDRDASQRRSDRPEATRASLAVGAGQGADDRPAGGGPSQDDHERQNRLDRPVPVREHRRTLPAPRTKIGKGALLAYAANSIFARKIGSGQRDVGECTRFDVVQIRRRGLIDQTVADGLLALDWPDEQKTPLYKVASETEVKEVFDRAYKVLDSLGMAHGAR